MGRYEKPGFWSSLNQARRGLVHTWKTQEHMKVHVVAGSGVLCIAGLCGVTKFEWLFLVLAIGCVIGAEVMNTAVETVVDLVEPNFHVLARTAKDVASGAVVVAVVQAVVIGMVVFLPRLVGFVSRNF
ncbi:MAG TPA: diacylglycerol kinase family protein [Desulfosporosinus sp.]|nr:diacylglycerol kinase family protein [Desulfosporosinus sp.]